MSGQTIDARAFHAAELTEAGKTVNFGKIAAVAKIIQEEADSAARVREHVARSMRDAELDRQLAERANERAIAAKVEALKRGEPLIGAWPKFMLDAPPKPYAVR